MIKEIYTKYYDFRDFKIPSITTGEFMKLIERKFQQLDYL
jgi:hypothetical protein